MTDGAAPAPAAAAGAVPAGDLANRLALPAQILASIVDAVHVTSPDDGRIVYANPACDRLFGYAPGELLGRPVIVLNAPEAGPPEATAAAIIAALQAQGHWAGDLLARRKDGSSFWTACTVNIQDLPQVGRIWLTVQRDIGERRRAEDAVRRSERRFRRVFSNTMVPMATWARDGRVTDANDALLGLVGYTREDLDRGQLRWDRLTPAAWAERDRQAIAELDALGYSQPYEKTFIHKDGREIPILIVGGRLDDDGEDGVVFLVDLSVRKRAEQALRDSQALLQSFYDSSPFMMGVADLVDGETVAVSGNAAVLRFVGLSAAELPGRTGRALGNSADFEQALAGHYRRSQQQREPVRFEHAFGRDGGTLWLSFTVAFLGLGPEGHPRFSFVAEDITRRKHAESALAEREAFLRNIADTIAEPIFVHNRDHTYRYLNPAALAIAGQWLGRAVGLDAMLGLTPAQVFVDQPGVAEMMALDERVMSTGVPVRMEQVVDSPSGPRHLMVVRAASRGADGEVIGLVGAAYDVTLDRQAEQRRLAEVSRQRDTLVREVHHRIKNHLHGVTGLLRAQADAQPALDPALSEVIGQISAIASVYGLQQSGSTDLHELLQLLIAAAPSPSPIALERPAQAPVCLTHDVAVPIALTVNELLTNAAKHRRAVDRARPVRVTLELATDHARLGVRGGPARLPAGFDFEARRGLGTGLELVAALLPSEGVSLSYAEHGDEVEATLRIGLQHIDAAPLA